MKTVPACPEQKSLPGMAPAESAREAVSAGTYSLRRLNYFSDAEQDAPSGAELPQSSSGKIVEDDFDAEQRPLIQHLHMVATIARHYAHRGTEIAELIRAGNMGLVHALERYQPGETAQFPEFATMYIRQCIERHLAERHGRMGVAQTSPQYAARSRRNKTAPGTQDTHQGIYVIRAFIESRISELRHSRHIEFSPEFSGLYD